MFCFSVESLDGDGADLRLLPSLRYAHSAAYLERLATQHGFEVVAMKHAPVREDQGEVIEGLYVILRRAPGPGRPQASVGSNRAQPPHSGGCFHCSTLDRRRMIGSPFPVSAG